MNGIERIAKERERQIEKEGWSETHDAYHESEEIAMAAACYAAPKQIYIFHQGPTNWHLDIDGISYIDPWPWSKDWDKRKKHGRIRQLEIAGALCAAEIDRLLRIEWDACREP